MSTFGSIASMIRSLKDNNALLKKKRGFTRLLEQREKATLNPIPFKKRIYTEAELQRIQFEVKEQFTKERKRNNWILGLAAFVIAIGIGMTFFMVFSGSSPFMNRTSQSNSNFRDKTEQNEKLVFYLSDGEKWLQEKNFHNALFQYREATLLKPDSYRAQVGLAKALISQCHHTGKGCNEAMQQVEKCIARFEPPIVKTQLAGFINELDPSVSTHIESSQIGQLIRD